MQLEADESVNIESQQYLLQKDKSQVIQEKEGKGMFQQNTLIMAPLDYNKIRDFLRKSARNHHHELEVCTTLQALSWRITKVSSVIRRQNLHSYQHYDILEIKLADQPNSVFQQLMGDKSRSRVKEFFIIFLNSLASEYLGRCYLL